MTNRYILEQPKTKAKVLAWLVEGKSVTEIAALVSTRTHPVSRQAVHLFKKRHAAELQPLITEVVKQIKDYAISDVVNRVADAQMRRDLLFAVQQARASGKTGEDTGIVAKQYKMVGSGENAMLVEEFKVDTAMLAEWRANERHVAEALDQLPKGDALPAGGTLVIIRERIIEHGARLEPLG